MEHWRVVMTIAQVIQETDTRTGKPICNLESCPKMSAGL